MDIPMTITHLARYLTIIILSFLIVNICFADSQLSDRGDVQAFISEMVEKHQMDPIALKKLFDQVDIKESILEAIARPAEKTKPWHEYKEILVTESQTKGGVKFWKEHKDILERAEKTFGVPPEIIVAIIGVESKYGKNTGGFRVIDSLTTLAFDYPPRSKFFRSELEQFLLLVEEQKFDPFEIKGSYAGAIGVPQFISSSYRHYAIDFSNNGVSDLQNDTADIIGSVANYFKKNGWRRGEKIIIPIQKFEKNFKPIDEDGLKPNKAVQEFAKLGIKPKFKLPAKELAALVTLDFEDADEYWLGLNNFYVISRYNKSKLYSMAVVQLSEKIKQSYNNNV